MRRKCQIAKLNIEYNILSKEIFDRLAKYETNSLPEYKITSKIVDKVIVKGKIVYSSKYYDLYYDNGIYIQAQRDLRDEKLLGIITYQVSEASIEIINGDDLFEAEYLMTQYATFYYILREKNALLIHSSSINYKDKAYLFCAKSGTGKSTHTNMWVTQGLASYINDDKNILVYEDGIFNAYGNPWSGKHALDNNQCVPLEGIIYLSRSKENSIKSISKLEAYKMLISHTLLPNPLYSKDKWESLVLNLLNTKTYSLGANISKDALLVVKKRLDGDLIEY